MYNHYNICNIQIYFYNIHMKHNRPLKHLKQALVHQWKYGEGEGEEKVEKKEKWRERKKKRPGPLRSCSASVTAWHVCLQHTLLAQHGRVPWRTGAVEAAAASLNGTVELPRGRSRGRGAAAPPPVPKNEGVGLQTWPNSPSPQPNQANSPPPFYSYWYFEHFESISSFMFFVKSISLWLLC